MTDKKTEYDVTIQNIGVPYVLDINPDVSRLNCGKMTEKEIDEYLQEMTHYKIPLTSCISYANLDFKNFHEKKVLIGAQSPIKEEHYSGFDIYLCMRNGRKCKYQDCFNNIRNGKCHDEFVRKIIGIKFFKNKYQSQK